MRNNWSFVRFRALKVEIKRKKRETREKRRFYFEREWMTIAILD
jgi:hypothetical protein